MPVRHISKPRGKITADDQRDSYGRLLRNQSPKSIQTFIVENFKGQGNTDIRPDAADIQNVRYLMVLSLGSDSPVSDFFAACFAYFQRSNATYTQLLRNLEINAKRKIVT
jgi:hypothetical protein